MTLTKGSYLWVARCNGSKVVVVGLDFVETFERASRFFWKNK